MSQNKKDQVVCHLRYLRQELREMHLGVQDDGLFPEPGEIRGILAQMEALLELIDGNSKVQASWEFISSWKCLNYGSKTSKNKFPSKNCW